MAHGTSHWNFVRGVIYLEIGNNPHTQTSIAAKRQVANRLRAGFVVSRSGLIEPGAATWFLRGMAGPRFSQIRERQFAYDNVLVEFQIQRSTERHSAGDMVRPTLLMKRRRSFIVDIVVVAPATSSSVGRVLG